MTFKDKVAKLSRAPQVREAFRIGGEIAGVAVHLTAGTTALGKASAALGVANAIMGKPKSLTSRFDSYPVLDLPRCLQACVLITLRHGGVLTSGTEDGKEKVWTLRDERGGAMHWVKSDSTIPHGPWLDGVDHEHARAMVGRALWESLGPRVEVAFTRWGEQADLTQDDLSTCLPSQMSREIAEVVGKYHTRGIHRSYLLHGPSGTGKSFILRSVAQSLGGLSLRVSSVGYGTERPLQELVKIMRPTTLIVDDICRSNTTPMLDAMETCKRIVPFIGASANYTGKMDPAIRRPGRFDRSVLIETLDEATFAAMTGHLDGSQVDKIRRLPAAYIAEYVGTAEVEGLAAANDLIPELLTLADEIESATLKADDDKSED